MKLSIQSFLGIAPKVPPRYLPDGGAQIATNVEATGQSVKPLPGTALLRSLSSPGGVIQTIYRFGQDLNDELEHWFRWATPVDVCRSQIAGDVAEWTCYTGDGDWPKATTNEIATQGGTTYPIQALRLGLPAPTARLTGTVALPEYCEVAGVRAGERDTEARCEAAGICKVNGTYNGTYTTSAACTAAGGVWTTQTPGVWIVGAKKSPAKITLTATILSQVTSGYGVKLSTNNGANFVTANPTGGGAPNVTITADHLNQMTEAYGIKVSIDNGLTWATSPLNSLITRNADLTFSSAEIASMRYQTYLDVSVRTNASGESIARVNAKNITSAEALVAVLSATTGAYNSAAPASLVKATVSGSGVYVKSIAQGSDVVLTLAWAENAWRTATGTNLDQALTQLEAAIETATLNGKAIAFAERLPTSAPTTLKVTADTSGADVKLVVRWGASDSMKLSATGTAADTTGLVAAINAIPISATYTGATAEKKGDTIVVSSVNVGKDATLRIRWGEATNQLLTATGVTADLGTKETRVYTYTWVLYEANVSWESAPCVLKYPATFDVYAGGSVTLSGFPAALPVGGWGPVKGFLKQRIYRAVSGTYLFVAEIDPGATFVDDLAADELNEPLPSALWTTPKETLKGIINLPNGMIAGFDGRDVCFSEPYRPYAWPDTYIMTVDYPIVGLGRMDTTLVVLTVGVPYFIQGAAPDVAVMVKSDIEQACVSKRSIVSMGGAVFYASPDGIMAISSGGSNMLTDGLFTRAQWQAYNPASIHAYGHDSQYLAFYTKVDGTQGGFTIDLKTKQFVTHNLWATCGYTDLRNDSLYLCDTSNNLNKWYAGANATGLWRSKVFSHPQPLGYTCVQVEAESYPLTCRIYCDGVQVKAQSIPNSTYYPGTFLIAKRAPFRLPVAHGRDWEVELDVKQEIFNVVLAQAPSELATA